VWPIVLRPLILSLLFLPLFLSAQIKHYTFGDSLEVDYLKIEDRASEPINYAWFYGLDVETPFANGGPTSLIVLPTISGFYQLNSRLRAEAGLSYGIRASLEMSDWLNVANYRAHFGLALTLFQSLKARYVPVLQSTMVTGTKWDTESGRYRTYIDMLIEDTAQVSHSAEVLLGINAIATSVGVEYQPTELINTDGSLDNLSSVQLRGAQTTFIELGLAYRARMKFLYSLNEFKTFKAYEISTKAKVLLPIRQRFDARIDQMDFLTVVSETREDVNYFEQYRSKMGFSFVAEFIFPRGTVDRVKLRRLKIEYINFPLVEQLRHVIKLSFSWGRGAL
jgi:hypothetical protein